MSVAASFGRAADYDAHAAVQRLVVDRLADRIAALPLPPQPRILEIGCGTGLLGVALADRLPDARWLMTDLSPAMLDRARQRFAGRETIDFAVMDGERPDVSGPFDLICSSLAFQWFADLPAAIDRLRGLLAPHGVLAFTTLAEGSFREWRDAHGDRPAGTRDYPSAEALAAPGLTIAMETIPMAHRDARDFLRAVKGIGAGVPRPGHRPLGPRDLRAVMRRFEAMGSVASYVVATGLAGPLSTRSISA
ncbi:methyltransferase [Sphingomonas abietis]|uniref:Methyltransferase n=1 Tax=Sphingomonas abietis TaxID=3012344 RepID=A0ABY7NRV0_9SPHN|nr:methyltransferase [Sphingomonas abietis]WBO23302.1 methyltransferase [Sphingomonas abietis]